MEDAQHAAHTQPLKPQDYIVIVTTIHGISSYGIWSYNALRVQHAQMIKAKWQSMQNYQLCKCTVEEFMFVAKDCRCPEKKH